MPPIECFLLHYLICEAYLLSDNIHLFQWVLVGGHLEISCPPKTLKAFKHSCLINWYNLKLCHLYSVGQESKTHPPNLHNLWGFHLKTSLFIIQIFCRSLLSVMIYRANIPYIPPIFRSHTVGVFTHFKMSLFIYSGSRRRQQSGWNTITPTFVQYLLHILLFTI